MKTSKLLFFIFLIIFVIISFYLITYSQGLIFNFNKFTFQKTGAIFLKIKPFPENIFLNNKKIASKYNWPNSLNFLNNGLLITKLKPNNYTLKIEKNNYRTWQKNILIEENYVTNLNPIILIEKNLEFETITLTETKLKDNIYFIGNNFITQPLKGDKIIFAQQDYYISFDQQKNIYYLFFNKEKNLINLNELFLNLKKQKNIEIVIDKKIQEKFLNFYPHPYSKNIIIIQTNFAFYNLDLINLNLELLFFNENEKSITYIDRNNIYTIDKNNQLISYNFFFKTKNIEKITLNDIEKITFSESKNIFYLLNKKNELLTLNSLKELKIFKTDVIDYYFSPSHQYLIMLNKNNQLEIYQTNLDKAWVLDFKIEKIKKLIFTKINEYFFVLDKDKLFLVELYQGNPTNYYLIHENVKDFELIDTNLYFLTENEIKKYNFENLK